MELQINSLETRIEKMQEMFNKDLLLDSVGEGEGGMFQEKSIETCILSRVSIYFY